MYEMFRQKAMSDHGWISLTWERVGGTPRNLEPLGTGRTPFNFLEFDPKNYLQYGAPWNRNYCPEYVYPSCPELVGQFIIRIPATNPNRTKEPNCSGSENIILLKYEDDRPVFLEERKRSRTVSWVCIGDCTLFCFPWLQPPVFAPEFEAFLLPEIFQNHATSPSLSIFDTEIASGFTMVLRY